MDSRFSTLSRIPKGVWVVGGVSMLMDISSEIIHSLLPLFMVTTLGASVIFIGLIEGLSSPAPSATIWGNAKVWRCWATGWVLPASRCLRSPPRRE